ncbi:cysteine--tRNA ligase [Endomicrobiia bacterium]|nr:cysteine--tRNA ligase [Endomicrobiia bacterium]GHT16324.1 cysteine--tRNA ligase [Endomicrobiia bacterium]GHT20638.1 cysteine--tRNA ligase [Endomicrobiia bacterium]GHT26224.1 cysteine--tRNA ligase [Endomicrobiia bacterium]GHT31646.1 cysteine--tRNA ligase [Endomicrobiia bacterium]
MTIKIHNTLSNKKEEFYPQRGNFVSMYVCGITPYDEVHLGHARVYVVFDIVKRHLLRRGYIVKHIQNFTDVDDKIVKRSQEKNMKPSELAQIYIEDYFVQAGRLNILKAEKYPCVTQMIPEIVNFIKELVNKGLAYEIGGDIYFSVEKFKDYGKLSKRNLKDLRAGARVGVCNGKNSAFDFALWKKTKENEPREVTWESPWGKGRPGWHIECSAMSSELLGDTIDIHGGGQDLIFPHHENEIAQSEAKTGKKFVKYWIHNGFVTINKEKMSKSLNNFFTLKAIFEKYNPRVVRYYLLTQHYSSPLDFSDAGIESARNTLQGMDDTYLRLISSVKESDVEITDKDLSDLQENFLSALDDDFNSEKALSYLHELKGLISKGLLTAGRERLSQLKKLFEDFAGTSLGILLPEEQNADESLQNLLKERNDARKNKNWAESDRVRKLIIDERGYKIFDNKDGSSLLVKKV